MNPKFDFETLESRLSVLYPIFVVLFLAQFSVAIHFLTIEPDEAWILLAAGHFPGGPFEGMDLVRSPTATSGGLHTLIHYILLRMGLPIEAHRAVSLSFCAFTLAGLFTLAKSFGSNRAAFATAAMFLTVPGILLQVGLATAEMEATFLVLLAAVFWVWRGQDSVAGSVLSGFILGLACATRMSALIALPAFVLWALWTSRSIDRRVGQAVLAASVAAVVFGLSTLAYYHLFGADFFTQFGHRIVNRSKSGADVLNGFAVAADLFSPAVLVVLPVALALLSRREGGTRIPALCSLLFLVGLIGWGAWVLLSPIPHVRYLWPALPALWISGSLVFVMWLESLPPGRGRIVLHTALVSVLAVQFGLSLRQVLFGDSLALVYEYARQMPTAPFSPLRARADQERLISAVAALPADAVIYALIEPAAYPVSLQTHRKITELSTTADRAGPFGSDEYLILLPSDKDLWTPTLAARDWIKDNTKRQARFGNYSLFRINPGARAPGSAAFENEE